MRQDTLPSPPRHPPLAPRPFSNRPSHLDRRGLSLLEILVTIAFTAAMMGPVLTAFQTGDRLSRRGERAFVAQTLARAMLDEISHRPFSDPDGADTFAVGLLPGPTHEEYRPDAAMLPNGTDEVTGAPRLVNETLLDRRRFYDDIDDYDGYNADGSIVPTDERGREPFVDGINPWSSFRVKVSVTSDASAAAPPEPFGPPLGPDPACLALTGEGDYALVADREARDLRVVNLRTGAEVDAGPVVGTAWGDTPATGALDRIPLDAVSSIETWPDRLRLGAPAAILPGPDGLRFHVVLSAPPGATDPGSGDPLLSGAVTIDLNRHETPEVSFKKLMDASMIARGLPSPRVTALALDCAGRLLVATDGGGLSESDDRGASFRPVRLERLDGASAARVAALAVARVRDDQGAFQPVAFAAGPDGLWRRREGPFRRVPESGGRAFVAVAATDGGFVAAADADGGLLVSADGGTVFAARPGPASGGVRALAVDDAGNIHLGGARGLFLGERLFDAGEEPRWSRVDPGAERPVHALHIDRSGTLPAPAVAVLRRAGPSAAPSLPVCPLLLASPVALHLLFLDDLGSGTANGSTPGRLRLFHTRSVDGGRTWSDAAQVSATEPGDVDWAHAAIADPSGALHVTWRSERGGAWRFLYRRSDDGGATWSAPERDLTADWPGGAAPPLDPLDHGAGPVADWLGSDAARHRPLARSPDNRMLLSAGTPATDAFHRFRESPDGGRTWPPERTRQLRKETADERLESIDALAPSGDFLLVVSAAGGRERTLLRWDGVSFAATRIATFGVARRSGVPPRATPEAGLADLFAGSDGDGNAVLHRVVVRYPPEAVDASTVADGHAPYAPISVHATALCADGRLFALFSAAEDPLLPGSGERLCAAFFRDGRFLSPRIVLDRGNIPFDRPAAAAYGEEPCFVRRAPPAPAGGDLLFRGFPATLLIAGAEGEALRAGTAGPFLGMTEAEPLPGERILCLAGYGETLYYGSPAGLFARGAGAPAVVAAPPDAGPFAPPGAEGMPDPPRGFRALLAGREIHAVAADDSGTIFAGGPAGLLRSEDGGVSFVPVGEGACGVEAAFAPGAGAARELESLLLLSRRPAAGGESITLTRHRLDSGRPATTEVLAAASTPGDLLVAPAWDGGALFLFLRGTRRLVRRDAGGEVSFDLSGKVPDSVARLVAAPDGRTLYALDPVGRRAYAIAGIDRSAPPAVASIPPSGTLPSPPLDLIFSPKAADGSFRTWFVCARTIVDATGAPLFAGSYDVRGAAVSDGEEIWFLDGGSRRLHRVVRANEKTVRVTVEDAPDAVSAMPPLTLARKFLKSAPAVAGSGLSPARDRVRHEYVYTSKEYPAGIAAGRSVFWRRHEPATDPRLSRIYVVDSALAVDGTLEIAAGTVVKFATDDKRALPLMGPAAGASAACIRVGPAGRLVVPDGASSDARALFTSLDDPACAPTVWNDRDAALRSAAGLPNAQPYRRTGGGNGTAGPRYGDYGAPGAGRLIDPRYAAGAPGGAVGALIFAAPGRAQLAGLDFRYALLSTDGLFPGGEAPRGEPARFSATNVLRVPSGGFAVPAEAELSVAGGAIVRVDGGNGIRIRAGGSFAALGSPARPVRFRHAAAGPEPVVSAVTGRGEGRERDLATATLLTADYAVLTGDGIARRVVVSRCEFPDAAALKTRKSGANHRYLDCLFGASHPESGVPAQSMGGRFDFTRGDASRFGRCLFAVTGGARFEIAATSAVSFHECVFRTVAGGDANPPAFLRVVGESVLRAAGCLFDHLAGDFPASRLFVSGSADLAGNRFRNAGPGLRVSCEVELASGLPPGSLPWLRLAGNRFERARVAVATGGIIAPPRPLDERLVGNDFLACERLLVAAAPPVSAMAETRPPATGELADAGPAARSPEGILFVIEPPDAVARFGPGGETLATLRVARHPAAAAVELVALSVNATGELYLVDRAARRVRKLDSAGREIAAFAAAVFDSGKAPAPAAVRSVALPTAEVVLVSDETRHALVKFSNDGNYLAELAGMGAALGKWSGPATIDATADGLHAWVADSGNDRAVKVELDAPETVVVRPAFRIEPEILDPVLAPALPIAGAPPAVWIPGDAVPARMPVRITVTALAADGTVDAAYVPAADLSLLIDPVPGAVLWAGDPAGHVLDHDATEADNGGTLRKEAFSGGVAKLFVAAAIPVAPRAVTVRENEPDPREGSASVQFLPPEREPGERIVIDLEPGPDEVPMAFRWIPPAMFMMGSPDTEPGRSADEGPRHPVVIRRGYWMAETECTQAQYRAVTGASPSVHKSPAHPDDPSRPVENVSWNSVVQAGGFMEIMNGRGYGYGTFRLPTEAEWEHACRADAPTASGAYPWAAAWSDPFGWCSVNAGGVPRAVGGGRSNGFGLHDMPGNVWEWCADWYAAYPGTPVPRFDPAGPLGGTQRILRGGGFANIPAQCRSAHRYRVDPAAAGSDRGFRPVIAP